MREHIIFSLKTSLEWRIIAFLITNIFFWVTTHEFWKATALAFELQAILLVVNFFWFFFKRDRYHRHADGGPGSAS